MQRFKYRSINVTSTKKSVYLISFKNMLQLSYALYFKYQLADHEVQTLNNLVNFYFRSLIEINIYFYLNTKYSSISDLIIILFSLFYPFNKFYWPRSHSRPSTRTGAASSLWGSSGASETWTQSRPRRSWRSSTGTQLDWLINNK